MTLPSFREAIGDSRNIGPGITLLRGGLFDESGESAAITLGSMNHELEDELSSVDPIEFMHDETPPDHLLSRFMEEKTKRK